MDFRQYVWLYNRILLYTKDFQKDGQTIYLPAYFTPFL